MNKTFNSIEIMCEETLSTKTKAKGLAKAHLAHKTTVEQLEKALDYLLYATTVSYQNKAILVAQKVGEICYPQSHHGDNLPLTAKENIVIGAQVIDMINETTGYEFATRKMISGGRNGYIGAYLKGFDPQTDFHPLMAPADIRPATADNICAGGDAVSGTTVHKAVELANRLQQQKFVIDFDYLATLGLFDFIGKKQSSVKKMLLSIAEDLGEDVADDVWLIETFGDMERSKSMKLGNLTHTLFGPYGYQTDTDKAHGAQLDLIRLHGTIAKTCDGETGDDGLLTSVGNPDALVAFEYRCDLKGRLYPKGAVTPASGRMSKLFLPVAC